nr:MAG TPA: hypothetical protein [Caudoviricetes sp.]
MFVVFVFCNLHLHYIWKIPICQWFFPILKSILEVYI